MAEAKKRKKGFVVGTLILFASLSFLFFTNVPKAVLEICSPLFQNGSLEMQMMQLTLMEKGGLYDQVGERLKEKGFEHDILGGITEKDKILVKFVLKNQEASDKRQEEIMDIFHDYIEKNNLNTQTFDVKVSNDTSTNW
ncbi:hypothetical protein [Psychrobacillus lasiicapitis]|uniref:Uncharacterized protein n=1 Tax=Psychrobacillus lasiicapitis TaxID=1636719 RepID=A0A544TGY5_9BACI|nr:hypothetical protein [Psychrobacillus lasiicapitis]TQR16696.1 hypothetical protein FG382_00600 [Psychrobacillus lasiicapitis]GGA27976.1 hypothetical protein GCM10011384_16680 [Psychrobacillus lasiicapitis]